MKMHQSDLDLEQRVWRRVNGEEEGTMAPLLRLAEEEQAGLICLSRSNPRANRLVSAAAANVSILRGMELLEGNQSERGQFAAQTSTGLLAVLCRGSQALYRRYEEKCGQEPAFRTLCNRELEIYSGLLELLGA